MKKSLKLKALILLVVLAMTSGCIKVETGMKISLTKDVEGFYIMGIMDQMLGQEGTSANPFQGDTRKLEDQGYKVSDYKEGGYTGVKATKSLGNLDDLSYEGELRTINLDKTDETTKYFKVEKGFLKNTYTAKFTTTVQNNVMDEITEVQNGSNPDEELVEETEVEAMVDEVDEETPETPTEQPPTETDDETPVDHNAEDETPNDDGSSVPPVDSETPTDGNPTDDGNNNIVDDDSLDEIKKMMQVNYRIELPTKALSSNATTKSDDGKVLEWNLIDWKEGSTIEFKFEAWNLTNLLIVGGGALFILIILIVMIVVSIKSKKKAEPAPLAEKPIAEVTDEKESAVTPVAPTEGTPALTPVGEATEAKDGPVTLDVPKVEEAPAAIPEVTEASPAPVEVEVPKIVTTPEITPTTTEPQEAKTE